MQEPETQQPVRDTRSAIIRITAAFGTAFAFCLGVYLLLDSVDAAGRAGLISFAFLLILPAAICAFVAYVADPWREKPVSSYLLIPLWILLVLLPFSIVFLREGTVCVIILAPLWLISGMVGAGATYGIRHRIRDGRKYCTVMLALPVLAIQIEPMIPLSSAQYTVSREVVINAAPEKIWPLLEGVPQISPNEGRWNFSQDIVGIPRPIGARLVGNDIGADRYARWSYGINFREKINIWKPGQELGWRFIFDNVDGWEFTDRHLLPDSSYYKIKKGGYRLTPVNGHKTRVLLHTTYWVRTPVNGYSSLWGEVFLGDVENNLLALIKHRAERS